MNRFVDSESGTNLLFKKRKIIMIDNIKTVLNMLRQLNYILDKKQKRQCCIVFVIFFCGAVFELLGMSSILPFLQALLNPEEMMQGRGVQLLLQIFHIDTTYGMVIMLGVGIILLYIVKNIYLIFSAYVQNDLNTRINKELSIKMLRAYMKRPYTFFLETNSAEILRGINDDVTGVNSVVSNLFHMISEFLTALMIAIYLLYMDWVMAIGIVVLAAFCFLGIVLGFKKQLGIMGKKRRDANANCNKHAYQAVNGIKEITVMQRKDNFAEAYSTAAEEKRKTALIHAFVTACPARIIEAVCVGGLIGVVCIRVGSGVELSSFVPQLGAFAVAAFRILPSISNISSYVSGLIFYRLALEEAYRNIHSAREYEKAMEEQNDVIDEAEEELQFQGEIAIKNIAWRYQNSKKNVLEELSMVIKKGESVAFIGSSGAGKSTLSDVILGLLRPQNGSVEMDGKDIFTIPKTWSRTIGYVPQTVFLIDDTIRNNISFGIPKEEVSDEKIWEALEMAQLSEFVKNLPQQLDTVVGERGIKFSGGQRQRVAIARALYYNPAILVLDEATSALDNETEAAVMEAIDALMGTKTLIIVAHRLTTIKDCDKIYEISGGKAILKDKKEIFK